MDILDRFLGHDAWTTRQLLPRCRELIARHDVASDDSADLARRIRDEGRFDETWLDVLDKPPTRKTYGGAIAHVISHNMHHRAELLHMLQRLGVPDLLEGDVLSWEALPGSA